MIPATRVTHSDPLLISADMMTQRNIDERQVTEVKTRELRTLEKDVKEWLAKGKPIKEFPVAEATVLHVAACKGYTDLVALLLKNGAPLEAYDEDGWTPLHAAARWEKKQVLKQLAEAGANLDAVTFRGELASELTDAQDIHKLLEGSPPSSTSFALPVLGN